MLQRFFAFLQILILVCLFPQKSLSKEASIAATYLRPELHEISFEEPFFRFDFSDLRDLRLGANDFQFRDFKVQISTLFFTYAASSRYSYAYVMSFNWPKAFMTDGLLSVETIDRQNILKKKIDKKSYEDWEKLKSDIRQKKIPESIDWNVRKMGVDDQDSFPEGNWGVLVKKKWERINKPFRFCLSNQVEGSSSKMCSPYLLFRKTGSTGLRKWKRKNPQGVFVELNGEPNPVKDQLAVNEFENINFSAKFDNGMLFEFIRKKPQTYFFDEIAFNHKSEDLYVAGRGEKPHNADWDWTGEPKESGLKNQHPRYYWKMRGPLKPRSVSIARSGVDAFEIPIRFNNFPPYRAKIYLKNEIAETYERFPHISGFLKNGLRLSVDSPAEIDFDEKNLEFDWEYYAPEKGKFNRAILNVRYAKRKYKSAFDIYRGYSSEWQANVNPYLLDASQFSLLGNAEFKYWFENLFGWRHSRFSMQRWGVGLKYTKSVLDLKEADNANNDYKLSDLQFSLRYRFSQGLWDRSKTWGVVLQQRGQEFTAANLEFKTKLTGLGVFLAQPVSKFEEKFLPFSSKPKFSHLEFTTYFPRGLLGTDGGVDVGVSVMLNYDVKVLFTSAFFGKFNLGFEMIDLSQTTAGVTTQLQFFAPQLGVGVGFNF